MISIRKFLDASESPGQADALPVSNVRAVDLSSACLDAYRSTLAEMGRTSAEACPATGQDLERNLRNAGDTLPALDGRSMAAHAAGICKQLQQWGQRTAHHYQQKAAEVKDMLVAMAQTAQSVSEHDQRCTRQLHAITAQLKQIATLDDITVMRRSIEQRTAELKTSIERMTEEGQTALQQLREKITTCQTRLEQAEEAANCDALTRLRSRPCVEAELERRITARASFCVAIFDIDGFKAVNDTHGHVIGDELLKQFAAELRSAFRSDDIVGRWGGDEFIVLLDSALGPASAQVDRVRDWVCGNYVVQGVSGPVKLRLTAAVGVAEHTSSETMKQLIDTADAAMYRCKTAARAAIAKA